MNTMNEQVLTERPEQGLRSLVQVEVRQAAGGPEQAAGSEQPILEFVASNARMDRYHEVIEPSGWRLDTYRRNPVFQNAHNYGDILFTLGKALVTEVRNVNGHPALCQRIQFATEVNPVARIAYGLYKGGFLNAVSVGFIPLRWEDAPSSSTGEPAPRRRFLEQELLEVSAVAIPANPDALALGLKSGAVVKADLQETIELLRALVGSRDGFLGEAALPGRSAPPNRILDLARELRRAMRKA